jgi:hypothetical protein
MNTARRGIDQSSEKLSPRRLDNRGPGTDRRRSFRRSNPVGGFGCSSLAIVTASASSASCARRSNFTSPIVGSVASLSTTRCPITRRSLVFRNASDSCLKRAVPGTYVQRQDRTSTGVPVTCRRPARSARRASPRACRWRRRRAPPRGAHCP